MDMVNIRYGSRPYMVWLRALIRRDKVETARDIIYRQNVAINGVAVEVLLKEQSLVPTSVSLFRPINMLYFH